MKIDLLDSLSDIPQEHYQTLWQSTCPEGYPFLRYEFLQALEASGSVGNEASSEQTPSSSGWQARHLVVREGDRLLAFMPLYLKWHSYGEYVFDWAWADAWQRSGLNYYPKLINAIPFTPCQGPRLLVCESVDETQLWSQISDFLDRHCRERNYSGWHSLFCPKSQADRLEKTQRLGCQFHWFNDNYQNFDDFIGNFSSRKRKQVKRERRQVTDLGIELHLSTASQLSAEQLDDFYLFYQMTYAKRSGHGGYLSREFFLQLQAMADQLLLVEAFEGERKVAASLYFYDQSTLFGRYWGCLEEFHSLHFEACYYQGIEFAIAQNLHKFDAGAQGEHKLARGFQPVLTHSSHFVIERGFHAPVNDFCAREAKEVLGYRQQCLEQLPFKRSG